MVYRIVVIFLAFLAASLAAGITIALALVEPEWPTLSGDTGQHVGFWLLAFLAASFSGTIVILPLFLLVVLAESFGLRSILLYMVAGGAIMLFGYFMSGFAEGQGTSKQPPLVHEAVIAAAGGIVFGLVYWLVAGRNAGAWRMRQV